MSENTNFELKFNGSIKFEDDKMVVSYNVVDDNAQIAAFMNTVDCDIEKEISKEPQKPKVFGLFGSKSSDVTFSSGIWAVLLKDVLKTVGGILISQIKKKVEKEIKRKFKSNEDQAQSPSIDG